MRDLPFLPRSAVPKPSTQLAGGDLATSAPMKCLWLVDCALGPGSGSWRRAPEAKWNLTPEGLERTKHPCKTIFLTPRLNGLGGGGRDAGFTRHVRPAEEKTRGSAGIYDPS